MIAVSDSVFSRVPWLIKKGNPQQRQFEKSLVCEESNTECIQDMAVLYENTECRIVSLKYIIIASITSYNLSLDSRNPRRLKVKQ